VKSSWWALLLFSLAPLKGQVDVGVTGGVPLTPFILDTRAGNRVGFSQVSSAPRRYTVGPYLEFHIHGPVGAGKRRAQGLYGAPVDLANFLKRREIVDEGRVDHAVRHSHVLAEAFEVVKIAAMHLGSRGHKRLGASLRAREAQNLMAQR